jgi:hypothetical protein
VTQRRRVTLTVTLAGGADHAEATAKMRQIKGVRAVHETFPGRDDPDLSNLHLVEVDARQEDAVLATLRTLSFVADAHRNSPRGLPR